MSSVSGEASFVIVSSRPLGVGGTSSFPFVYKPLSETPVSRLFGRKQ